MLDTKDKVKANYLDQAPTRKQLRRLYVGRAIMWFTVSFIVAAASGHHELMLAAGVAIAVELMSALAVGDLGGLGESK